MVRLTAAIVILIVASAGTDAVAQSASSRTPASSLSATVSASHNVRIRLRRFQQFSDAGVRVLGTPDNRGELTVRAIRLFTNHGSARVVASYGEERLASLVQRQDDPSLFASTNNSDAAVSQNRGLLYYLPQLTVAHQSTRYITMTE